MSELGLREPPQWERLLVQEILPVRYPEMRPERVRWRQKREMRVWGRGKQLPGGSVLG